MRALLSISTALLVGFITALPGWAYVPPSERIAAAMQGVDSNFHTDLFMPLIQRAEELVKRRYDPDSVAGTSFRVLADHARAVAFLVADGVFPTNEGRGYVLRRILRRASRHAWLLGRREPTLYEICDEDTASVSGPS